MDIEVYKLIHLLGIVLLFQALGAAVVLGPAASGAPWRRAMIIGHGLGLFLILLGGFGMLARLGISWPFPGWVFVKLTIWLALGAAPTIVRKMTKGPRILWGLAIGLGFLAAYMAIYKPF